MSLDLIINVYAYFQILQYLTRGQALRDVTVCGCRNPLHHHLLLFDFQQRKIFVIDLEDTAAGFGHKRPIQLVLVCGAPIWKPPHKVPCVKSAIVMVALKHLQCSYIK